MKNFKNIINKLEEFIRKYYVNELIKGAILFFSIGLLYFLATLLIEHFLWLSPILRAILFWLIVVVEAILFVKYIVIPLARLFKLQKGINHEDASKIIGNHFSEVNDKLLNVLQLNKIKNTSELLLASIEQKSKEINPTPFKLAINFKENVKYLKYAVIPILIVTLSFLTGHFDWFSDSYNRVINYRLAYEPPAPFQFFVVNDDLQAIENKAFTLKVITKGDINPENVEITFNGETYYLKQHGNGEFEYVFMQPKEEINFNLSANNIVSKPYTIDVLKTPTLLSFDMLLDYPTYTKRKDETLKNTGNTTVPQGTKITWQLRTKETDNVYLYSKDTLEFKLDNQGLFEASKRVNSTLDYSLNTSNSNIKDYESLTFSINVIKDEYPELKLQMEQDSLNHQTLYFFGMASDDYGLSKLQLVYFPSEDENDIQTEAIPISKSNFEEFLSVFPDNLNLKEGVSYNLYFEVFDNDVIHGLKSTKSATFNYRKLTKEERERGQLIEQEESIEDINKSLQKFEEQDKELNEISKNQKEKLDLNFSDKRKLEDFLKRQIEQEEMMQNFNKKLKDNLEDFQKENDENDSFKEDLEQRLDENKERLEKDEELLKELQKIAEKIQKEELTTKLEELAKQNKSKKRSLEQLLELTKRYYVAMKAEKLRTELVEQAKEQEKLSEESEENNTEKNQNELNKKFEDFQKELDELHKDNKGLMEPLDIPQDKKEEEEIKNEQKEASENLKKNEDSGEPQEKQKSKEDAKKNQKKAVQKMLQMSKKMEQMSANGGAEQLSEDFDMLRQILDNLVLFSFEQEDLMNQFNGIQINHNEYAKYLRKQQGLREHFEHIDDSLFALSLRQPMISESINKEVSEIYFNIDKSLNQLSENGLNQGVVAQRYIVSSANMLANLLSDILDNLEAQLSPMPGKGQGEGKDMQLPDIIMSQEQLNEQMKQGLEKSEDGNKKDGEKEGESQKDEKEGNKEGEGGEFGEELNGELFKIYQQQQQIRQALENRLEKEGLQGLGNNLLKRMEAVEQDLLDKGFTNNTLERMIQLQHQLLKLENATFQQGEDNKRKSVTNKEEFANTTSNQLKTAKQYFRTTEILNRHALPLRQVYKKRAQDYFKREND